MMMMMMITIMITMMMMITFVSASYPFLLNQVTLHLIRGPLESLKIN